MTVRAKFTVSAITKRQWGGAEIEMSCQYDQSTPEDLRFQKATPSGSIKMQVDNPAVLEVMTLGTQWYADFNEVPAPPKP